MLLMEAIMQDDDMLPSPQRSTSQKATVLYLLE